MPDLTKTHAQAPPAATHEPIFVDPSGRRRQQVLTVGVITVGLMSMYALVMLFALLGDSTVAAPPLPPQAKAGAEAVALGERTSTNPSPAPVLRGTSTARETTAPTAPQPRSSAPSSAAETSASASAQGAESADPGRPETEPGAEPTDPAPGTTIEESAPGKSAAAPGRSETKPSRPTAGPAKPTHEARP